MSRTSDCELHTAYNDYFLIFHLQISDLHISKFRNHDRITDFRKFVDETLDVIKPPVVVASGDLTDGRGLDAYISQQNEDEWKIYNEILRKANVAKRTKWLDLRGNHGGITHFTSSQMNLDSQKKLILNQSLQILSMWPIILISSDIQCKDQSIIAPTWN